MPWRASSELPAPRFHHPLVTHGDWVYVVGGQGAREAAAGVYGGRWCTHAEPSRFFSHRRDGAQRPTGRMATLIWMGSGTKSGFGVRP